MAQFIVRTPEEFRALAADLLPDVDYVREGTEYKHNRNVHRFRLLSDKARFAEDGTLLYLADSNAGFGGNIEHYDADNFRSNVPHPDGVTLIHVYTD